MFSDTEWILLTANGSVDLSINDFTKTLSGFVDCLRWQTLYFNTSVALRINITFQKFNFGESGDVFRVWKRFGQNRRYQTGKFQWFYLTKQCDIGQQRSVDLNKIVMCKGVSRIKNCCFGSRRIR